MPSESLLAKPVPLVFRRHLLFSTFAYRDSARPPNHADRCRPNPNGGMAILPYPSR
ncbi:hypothetical protein IBX77_00775 [Neisseria gonorrhoeae]|nr:hypothetical protein IBX77_00775 [Neisseria gonorrhoeae]